MGIDFIFPEFLVQCYILKCSETDDTIAVQATRLKDQAAKITELQHRVLEMTAREDSLKSQVELAKQHAQQVGLEFLKLGRYLSYLMLTSVVCCVIFSFVFISLLS